MPMVPPMASVHFSSPPTLSRSGGHAPIIIMCLLCNARWVSYPSCASPANILFQAGLLAASSAVRALVKSCFSREPVNEELEENGRGEVISGGRQASVQ